VNQPLYDTCVSLFIYIGLFSHLQCITKTLTLPTLGLPPMHACCSSSSCHFPCARFLACACCVTFQLLLPFLHAFFLTIILLSTSAWCQPIPNPSNDTINNVLQTSFRLGTRYGCNCRNKDSHGPIESSFHFYMGLTSSRRLWLGMIFN
jgi:hypothetical protein